MENNLQLLVSSQRRTDERLDRVAALLEELATAQARTEARIEELAAPQARTEVRLGTVAARMEELAEAQKRTEEQLHLLTLRVDQLAEAPKRTEVRLDRTSQLPGNLSMSFGYFLENESYKYLPALLASDYGMEVKGELIRSYVQDKKEGYITVNILVEAEKNGDSYLIVGESKSQLSVNAIDKFIYKKLERIPLPEGKKLFPVIVCHMVSGPEVPDYSKRWGIALYYSYQFR